MISNFTKQKVALLIITALGSFIIGMTLGSYLTLKAVSEVASRFMDPELVEQAITLYKNNIKNCFPLKL